MNRNLAYVLEQVLAKVPPQENLRKGLLSIQESARYSSPEAVTNLWIRTSHLLGRELGEPSLPWHFEISKIMQGEKPE